MKLCVGYRQQKNGQMDRRNKVAGFFSQAKKFWEALEKRGEVAWMLASVKGRPNREITKNYKAFCRALRTADAVQVGQGNTIFYVFYTVENPDLVEVCPLNREVAE